MPMIFRLWIEVIIPKGLLSGFHGLERRTYRKPEGGSGLTQTKIGCKSSNGVLVSEVAGAARREHTAGDLIGRGSSGVQPQRIKGVINSEGLIDHRHQYLEFQP